jgi:hypothetical protein
MRGHACISALYDPVRVHVVSTSKPYRALSHPRTALFSSRSFCLLSASAAVRALTVAATFLTDASDAAVQLVREFSSPVAAECGTWAPSVDTEAAGATEPEVVTPAPPLPVASEVGSDGAASVHRAVSRVQQRPREQG